MPVYVLVVGEMLQVLARQERFIELWLHICEIGGREDVCFLHRKETFSHKFNGMGLLKDMSCRALIK